VAVFAKPFIGNPMTKFDKYFFEKSPKTRTTMFLSFIEISANVVEIFKKQSVTGLYSHPVANHLSPFMGLSTNATSFVFPP
jgi:hypothetical protein